MALCFMFVLLSVYANIYAIIIEITVAIVVTIIEFAIDSLKALDVTNLLKSAHSTFASISIKG